MNLASSPVLPADWAPLVERLRVAHLKNTAIDVDDVQLGTPTARAGDAIVVDASNGLVDVDARLSLAAIARVLAQRGWVLPLVRPLPATPLWRLALRAPIVVDAVVQRGLLLTVDGDVVTTPAAPRHSTGPSLLHATTAVAPLALLVRAHLRVLSRAHTALWHEDHGSVDDVALRLQALGDEGRAFAADAHGTRVWILGGTAHAPAPSTPPREQPAPAMGGRWASARSLRAGDAPAFAAALRSGHRVIALPAQQRAAVLERARTTRALFDLHTATTQLATALTVSSPAKASR